MNARDLLMRMMEMFVLKFKTVSKLQLPVLMSKHLPPPPPTPAPSSGLSSRAPLPPGIPSLAPPQPPATPGD